jgi:two-component system NtrC family sensor kinase
MRKGESISATDVIPVEQLSTVGLDTQARIELVDTPLAVEKPFDAREGEAGLALVGVAPIKGGDGKILGSALAMYLFNNDFTLVDRIKQVAGVDTVTIFFGDLRVSTNVMTKEGLRAIGTRLSEEVFNVVLRDEQDYIGEALSLMILYHQLQTLLNFKDEVIGIIYVGREKSGYQALLDFPAASGSNCTYDPAAVIAIPIARYITRPIISCDATACLPG